jgi:hypothetical protein
MSAFHAGAVLAHSSVDCTGSTTVHRDISGVAERWNVDESCVLRLAPQATTVVVKFM